MVSAEGNNDLGLVNHVGTEGNNGGQAFFL